MFIFFLITLSFSATVQELRNCVIECADAQLGKPYVLCTEGPDTFDCSGLVSYCYDECGIGFGYRAHTWELIEEGIEVTQDELVLADLVFPSSGHVQLYHGDGQIIHAPHSGEVVKIQDIYAFWRGRRCILSGTDGDADYDPDTNGGSATSVTALTAVNARAAASTSAEIISVFDEGESIPFDSVVYSEERYWVSYTSSGTRRYVCGRAADGSTCYVTPCPAGTGSGRVTVTASTLNVRELPSTSSSTVATYSQGETIPYDSVWTNDECRWLSYVAGSGNRRYVCIKSSSGTEYVTPMI